jgi:cytidyltransferase-like protein
MDEQNDLGCIGVDIGNHLMDHGVDDAQWRRQGLRIGFTNGCFDLLHPDHIKLLGEARAACDRLIIGLNGDASVRRLKGERRPIQEVHARAEVLAALEAVDLVVVFNQAEPLDLIPACGDVDFIGAIVCPERGANIPLDLRTFLQWMSR